jgi:hypothetical protein
MDRDITACPKGKCWCATAVNKPQAIAEKSKAAESAGSVAATQRLVGRGAIREGNIHMGAVGSRLTNHVPFRNSTRLSAPLIALLSSLQSKPLSPGAPNGMAVTEPFMLLLIRNSPVDGRYRAKSTRVSGLGAPDRKQSQSGNGQQIAHLHDFSPPLVVVTSGAAPLFMA